MNHTRILRRAWDITWRYRALWVFGILAAIFAGGSGGGGGGGNTGFRFPGGRMPFAAPPVSPEASGRAMGVVALFVLLLVLVAIVLAIAGVVLRYISETALIRMVDDYERTGTKRRVREGFRLGWSRGAWRLFLIDLLIYIPVVVAFIVLFFLTLSPLLLLATGSDAAGAIGVVMTIGLVLLLIIVAILVAAFISLLKPFFWRKAVLEDRGVFASIGEGYRMVRRHFKEAGTMWLLLLGIGIVYGIAMIPLTIVLLIVAGVVAAIPAAGVGLLVGLFATGGTPWLFALIVGAPIFFILMVVPLVFVSGLWLIYQSSAWTLTYRELRAIEGMPPAPIASGAA